ncbi:MAG: hypothetical protein WDN46_13635 [Methylocella sp.]
MDQEPQVVLNKTEARQGSNRAPLHYVLYGGLALVIVAFALIYLLH